MTYQVVLTWESLVTHIKVPGSPDGESTEALSQDWLYYQAAVTYEHLCLPENSDLAVSSEVQTWEGLTALTSESLVVALT